MSRETPLEPETIEPQMCTVDLRHDILSRVPFFASLAPDEIADVNERFRDTGYEPGEPIYVAGERATHLYVVAMGKVKLLRHTRQGKDVLLDVLVPAEFFGTLSALEEAVYPDTAQAQTMCCVLAIAAEAFQAVLQRYPAVSLRVLELMAARLQDAHETIRQLSAHNTEQRIAATLLKLAEKLGEETEEGLLIQMPLSRQDVAEMTGTTTATASRVLSQFRKAGLIRSGREWIAITGREDLAALAPD